MAAGVRQIVRLSDHRHRKVQYLLDPPTGHCSSWKVPSTSLPLAPWSGYGCWVRLGLLPPRRVFVALYVQTDTLWFQLGSLRLDLRRAGFSLDRRIAGPFLRRFTVRGNGTTAYSTLLWAPVVEEAPWPADGDILSYAANVAKSDEAVRQRIAAWTSLRDEHRNVDGTFLPS